MSSPWDRSPLAGPDVDPASRRRRALVAGGVVALALVLALVVLVSASGSGGNKTSPAPGGATTAASTTTTTAAPATPTAVAPIQVQAVVGVMVIAGHMACFHEDDLHGDSLADVEAAVAADNDASGGAAASPYAHDAAAQSEIVRASVEKLHGTGRFFADCRPVTVATGSSSPSTSTDGGSSTGSGSPTEGASSSSSPPLPASR